MHPYYLFIRLRKHWEMRSIAYSPEFSQIICTGYSAERGVFGTEQKTTPKKTVDLDLIKKTVCLSLWVCCCWHCAQSPLPSFNRFLPETNLSLTLIKVKNPTITVEKRHGVSSA